MTFNAEPLNNQHVTYQQPHYQQMQYMPVPQNQQSILDQKEFTRFKKDMGRQLKKIEKLIKVSKNKEIANAEANSIAK